MDTKTVLLIILAAIVALGLVLFQYFYQTKNKGKLPILLAVLRFISLFSILLLLINPKFSKQEYTVEKTNLILLTDNSSSISKYRETVNSILSQLNNSKSLESKFIVNNYHFGSALINNDSISFTEHTTNIGKALHTVKEVYRNNAAIVLLTDGNQTIGTDYTYELNNSNINVYPIAIGDTTQYEDIRIDQVNANKYAFLKNKYPVEFFVTYEGHNSISKAVSISLDGKKIYNETVKLSRKNNTKIIKALLEAGSVGIKHLEVAVTPIDSERNTNNNKKNLTIEVVDEKTNVAIVTEIMHPDIGALKKSIERNEQRSVRIIKPTETQLDEIDIFILYQPTSSFKSIYQYINNKKVNTFSVLGPNTDLRFVNSIQKQFIIDTNYPIQEIVPIKNDGFLKFDISNISFSNYPPLASNLGPITLVGEVETLLKMKIKGQIMETPLLSIISNQETKSVLLVGENIWKWRIQDFRNNQDFEEFDELIGKLMIYLSDDQSKERLTIDYKSVYEGNSDVKINASYFNQTFEFDNNAELILQIKNKDANQSFEFPMLLKNGYYQADLSNQSSGNYQFTIRVKGEDISKSGTFRILDYDVEQQFVSTNDDKLLQLAEQSGGRLSYANNTEALIKALTVDERYLPVQKSTKKIVFLIDFRIILGIMVFTLALEWFIRKFNGLL
ncbi:VWA domain-containing protein [Kriegella sp. EG-1]|nr:VWA domain-containing protein [Flavobacteriaceae bacterium EG-1]